MQQQPQIFRLLSLKTTELPHFKFHFKHLAPLTPYVALRFLKDFPRAGSPS